MKIITSRPPGVTFIKWSWSKDDDAEMIVQLYLRDAVYLVFNNTDTGTTPKFLNSPNPKNQIHQHSTI